VLSPFQPQKRLLLGAEIAEILSSAKNDFLPKPTFDLPDLVKALIGVQRSDGDTIIELGDGQSTAYSDLLKSKCNHFETVFSSEFQEARQSLLIRSTAATTPAANTREDAVINEEEPSLDCDSDFEENSANAIPSGEVRRELKLVKLPNFS